MSTMKASQDPKKLEKLSDKLYEKYGKPLEKSHKGEYIAVSFKGGTILGQDLYDVVKKAVDAFGPANSFIFKVGDIAVWKWR